MERRVIRREEDRFRAADGASLHWRRWLPSDPRRVVLLVHGYAEHSGRYDGVGAWLATHDTAAHAFDLRGHGRSEGSLDRRDPLAALRADLGAVVEHLRKEYGELPLVVLGHQLGGRLTLRALADRALDADAAITTGAALEAGGGSFPARPPGLHWLARFAPRLGVATGIDPAMLSRDPQVVRTYREDPLVKTRVPAALAAAVARSLREGVHFAAAIRVPVLLVHGEADALCPAAGSRHARAALRGGGHALHVYPQLYHDVLQEPEADEVMSHALRWVEERGL